MPRALRLFTYGALLLSLVVTIRAATTLETLPPAVLVAVFLCAYVFPEMFQVNLPSGAGVSLGSAVVMAALVLCGSPFAVLLQAVGAVAVGLLRRAPAEWLGINLANYVLSVAVAGVVFDATGGTVGHPFVFGGLPFAASILALCLSQVLLASVGLGLYKGRPLRVTLLEARGPALGLVLATVAFSPSVVAAAGVFGAAPVLAVAALAAVGLSFSVRSLSRRTQERILGELVPPQVVAPTGEPGPGEGEHDLLVRLVTAIAAAAELAPSDDEALRWAALLHDTGVGDTSPGDSGLGDPGGEMAASAHPPSAEQIRKAEEHPLREAMRVGRVGNLVWVARILETHHEHHNGWGYPFGLQGDDIPFPAALLGLAEAYLALTGLRPVRPSGLGRNEAMRRLRTRTGEQFHPRAVQALEKALDTGVLDSGPALGPGPHVEEVVQRLRRVAALPRLAPRPSPVGEYPPAGAGSDLWFKGTGGARRFLTRFFARDPLHVFHQEHRLAAEWYRSLFNLGRLFSSSLSVREISDQLAEVVHHLTTLPCLVHLVTQDGRTLRPAAARGFPEEVLVSLSQDVSEGLIGMAFQEKRPVTSVNVGEDPRAVLRERAATLGVKSALVLPLMMNETPLGAIAVNSPTIRRFPPSEVHALSALGSLAAIALHNAVLYRKASDSLEQTNRTQRFLRTVFDTVPLGILTLDSDGRLSLCNRQASGYLADLGLGAEAEDTSDGRRDIVLGLRDNLGATAPQQALESGRPYGPDTVSAILRGGSVAGSERFFEVWAAPLHEAGDDPIGVLVVLDDVTTSKRLEAEVRRTEKLAAVGEVAAKAAHEIKNPIASVLGFMQLMGLYCPVRDQWTECSSYVDRAADEIGRLGGIAQAMLTLASPGRPALEVSDLSRPIRDTVELLAGKASEQGVTLEGPVGPTGALARFDPRQMRQVLLNLAQNALDAVSGPGGPPPGRRMVSITFGFTRRQGRRSAFVQVRDNGPGISDEDRPKIFTPFFTTKEIGTGLGLPVSRSIIEANNGTLEVRQAPGRGAVFEILLPAPWAERHVRLTAESKPDVAPAGEEDEGT